VHNEFTAIIEQDGAWYIAYCLEIPGANGQGRTPDEARESLAEVIALILTDRREDGLRGVPPEAIRESEAIREALNLVAFRQEVMQGFAQVAGKVPDFRDMWEEQ
jgi:predicted RNase H-like HicB family nuclease